MVETLNNPFFLEKVEFLAFQVSGDGIKSTEYYICIIRDMQVPKTVKDVASLLELLGYYCDFITSFARLTQAMNALRVEWHLTADN